MIEGSTSVNQSSILRLTTINNTLSQTHQNIISLFNRYHKKNKCASVIIQQLLKAFHFYLISGQKYYEAQHAS